MYPSRERMDEFINAARRGHLDTVQRFVAEHPTAIDCQDKDGRTALMWAAASGQLEEAKFLVNNGADINAEDNTGQTPLILSASVWAHPQMTRFLLARGANADHGDHNGDTALVLTRRYLKNREFAAEVIEMLEKWQSPAVRDEAEFQAAMKSLSFRLPRNIPVRKIIRFGC